LPLNDILEVFNQLADRLLNNFGDDEPHQQFIEYMENTWVGRARRNPRFRHEMWNSVNVTLLHLPRTTNSAESWHNILQKIFKTPHPNIFTFIEGILAENVRVNALCFGLDMGEEVPLYSSARYRRQNEGLLRLMRDFVEKRSNPNPALRGDPLEYMKICSRFVKYNNGPEEEEEEEQQ
jgi:hypothetical protein